MKQGKLTANEYYRKFTDLSRYDPVIAPNFVEMLRRFKLGSKKKWLSMATILPCATYQEFYEVLLRIEDSDKMPSESEEEEEEKGGNLKKYDKGKGQLSQGPRQTQSFKKSGTSSSSSSGGFSATGQRRGGRFTGGSRFQRPRETCGSGAPLCRRCNNRHFGECRRGSIVSQTRGVVRRADVFTLIEVKEDDSRHRGVSTTFLCRIPRTILTY